MSVLQMRGYGSRSTTLLNDVLEVAECASQGRLFQAGIVLIMVDLPKGVRLFLGRWSLKLSLSSPSTPSFEPALVTRCDFWMSKSEKSNATELDLILWNKSNRWICLRSAKDAHLSLVSSLVTLTEDEYSDVTHLAALRWMASSTRTSFWRYGSQMDAAYSIPDLTSEK